MLWGKCMPIAFKFRQCLFCILTNCQTYCRIWFHISYNSGMYLRLPVIPVRFTCILQGIFCNTGIPYNFYGEKICSVALWDCWWPCEIGLQPFTFHLQIFSVFKVRAAMLAEPFLSGLQKVILAWGCKYFSTLAINFCTHEDLEQNLILLINSLKSALKFVNNSFAFGFRHHNILFA